MKTHSTNYRNTFIAIADDCPVNEGQVPPERSGQRTIANIQFDMILKHPYKYSSDDVIFGVYAERNDITKSNISAARQDFFSKGQACLRCSPLTKRYGWGVHCDANGKVALYAAGTPEYDALMRDKRLTVVKAMRQSR